MQIDASLFVKGVWECSRPRRGGPSTGGGCGRSVVFGFGSGFSEVPVFQGSAGHAGVAESSLSALPDPFHRGECARRASVMRWR